MLVAVLKGHTSKIIGCDFLGMNNLLSVDESGILNVFNFKVANPIASQMINKAKFKEVAFFTNKQQFALLSTDNRIFIVQVHNVTPCPLNPQNNLKYEFMVTKEFILSDCKFSSNLGTFRGNSNILLVSCEGKEVRMISTKSGAILNSMTGVAQPIDYFVIGTLSFPLICLIGSCCLIASVS
jgi:hypothetical protein